MKRFGSLTWILILALTACSLSVPDQTVRHSPIVPSPTLHALPPSPTVSLPQNSPLPGETSSPTASLVSTSASEQATSSFPYFMPGDIPNLTQVRMFSEQVGWALAASDRAVSHVLFTLDGGRTWQEVTPPFPPTLTNPQRSLPLVAFLDPEHAWVIFTTDEPYPPIPLTVFGTLDGGATWTSSQPLEPEPEMEGFEPRFLQFIDPSTGWLMVAHGAAAGSAPISIYRTEDGGASWQRVQEPLGPQSGTINVCCQSGMLFTSPTEGVITSFAGPISEARLNWTRDGGRTWQSQSLPPPASTATAYCSTSSPQSPQRGSLYILVECLLDNQPDPLPYLYFTSDSGQSWNIQSLPSAPLRSGEWSESNRNRQIYFPSLDSGWYTVQDIHFDTNGNSDNARSFIYHTQDGGRSWQSLTQTAWAADFSFLEEGLVWAAAHKGPSAALVFSSDHGQTWKILDTHITPREEP